jgi:hypothetical protein
MNKDRRDAERYRAALVGLVNILTDAMYPESERIEMAMRLATLLKRVMSHEEELQPKARMLPPPFLAD